MRVSSLLWRDAQPLLNLLATVFWVVYITNAINLLDNMDGLAGGVSAIAAAYFALICAFGGQYLVGALSVAVLATCLGFLFYNPAVMVKID